MADITELVARLRALAAKFDKLSGFTGEYFSDIWKAAVVDANCLVEEIYDAGFLLSIETMDERKKIIDASPQRSLAKMFLFDWIVGFTLIPSSRTMWETVGNGEEVLTEYWYLEPGLLKQKPIYVEDRRTVDLDDFHKRHGFDLCDRCARGCEMLIEVIEREMAEQKPIQQADDGEDGKRVKKGRVSANTKMIEYAQKHPEAAEYSAEKWRQAIGARSKSTIAGTAFWKNLMKLKEISRAELLERQSNAASDESNAPGKPKKIKPKDLQ
jgi:hypothetical protein